MTRLQATQQGKWTVDRGAQHTLDEEAIPRRAEGLDRSCVVVLASHVVFFVKNDASDLVPLAAVASFFAAELIGLSGLR